LRFFAVEVAGLDDNFRIRDQHLTTIENFFDAAENAVFALTLNSREE